MAPIQNKSSSSSSSSSYVHKSSSSHDSTPHRGRDFASDSAWESFLPVTRRGRFFQDSFFENTRSSFDDAVRDALSRWGDDSDFLTDSWHDTTSPRNSNLSRYRHMRSRNVDDDNLAVTVTSDSNIHKIVLDVHDFVEGDLKVKVVGERELLVEGRREKAQDGASALSTQKFSRRFNLPEETDIAAIDSVMSSDGILTITAPKAGRIGSGTTSRSETSSFSSSATKKLQDEREPCECDKCNPRLQTREHNYHTNVERAHSSTSADNLKSKLFDDELMERSEQRDSKLESGRKVNSYCQEQKKNSSSAESSSHRLSDKMDVPIRAFFNSRPITRRGRFFDDSFFEDTRGDYRTAIQDVLSRWGEKSSNMDDMTSYRNMRTRDLREDNQAVRTIEDEFQHKFIVDVQDFMKDGEINVKAVDDRELVVEGNVVKQEGATKSIKKFSRRFLLPSDVHLESVSSVMSSDGVLTIIAPKKTAIIHMKETHTPVSAQKIENNADIYEKMSECNIQSSSENMQSSSENVQSSSENILSSSENMQSSSENMQSSSENQAYEKTSIANNECDNVEYEKTSMLDSNYGNVEHDERGVRGSSTCSSGLDTSSTQGDTSLQSSVTSKVFQAETSEEMNKSGGHNISIHVDAVDDDAMSDQKRSIRERSHDDMDIDLQEAKQKIIEELFSEQRSARARDMEDSAMEQRSTREKSMDDLETDMRSSTRERSMESRDRKAGSTRFDREFDFDEEDEDDINFQESSRHAEKRHCSVLKTPERYLKEEDERNSRERSYAGEESVDGDRRTPCRDHKRAPSCVPLNPEDKRVLPISIRGHFSSDAFFNDFQENFKTALSDVLLKFNEKSTKTDDITAYRNLRLRDPKLENQAFHVQEDQGAHKVVLDVKDFINGDIEAAVYDEKELVVEGRAERRTGTSITTLCFLRRFPLPENVDTDAITVVMSSDGVLTVVTPWKGFSGLSAIKNILSTEDKSMFDRPSNFDRRWDDTDWESARDSEEFMNRSLDSRLRSRLRHATDDLF